MPEADGVGGLTGGDVPDIGVDAAELACEALDPTRVPPAERVVAILGEAAAMPASVQGSVRGFGDKQGQ